MRRLVVAAVLAGAGLAYAHVRLQTSGGTPLGWQSPGAISIVVGSTGSDDLADGSHATAIRNAIDAWNAVSGTSAQLVENTNSAQRARTDYASDTIHLVLFDESNASGYFANPGTVAITPVWFFSDGRIVDADILFNGADHAFATCKSVNCAGTGSDFDVQDVATHELGHFLGLDHSGMAGATMYPYVDPSVLLHRSLSVDDAHGLRDAYPSGAQASLIGTVRRLSNNSVVAGASVVVRDVLGRNCGSALSRADGTFSVRGLDPGAYDVWVTPLDFPVSSGNLGGGQIVQTDFESSWSGSFFMLNSGETLQIGDFFVDADVAISLGRNADNYPLRCIRGTTTFLTVRGSGLSAGSTLVASDPNVTVLVSSWLTTQVNFQVTVAPDADPGHVDLLATDSGGNRSLLPAALEITPADPTVGTVAPSSGSDLGGNALTLTGTGFSPGARVVIGPNVYVDGEPGGCTVDSSTQITLTTAATAPGAWDVVVIDPTGVEGRKLGGFTALSLPQIDSIFPAAGQHSGGTLLTLRGSNFQAGAVVRIDGVQQSSVTVVDATRLSVTTDAGTPGGPYVLEVENPDSQVASTAFVYVAQPDPAIVALDPASGPAAGGQTLQLSGSGLGAVSEVVFGADPETGLGGTPAASVVVLDAGTLEVVTPATGAGARSVLVRTAGGQASVLPAAFTFVAEESGGGGGCSVGALPPRGRGPFEGLSSWLAPCAALLLLGLRARRLGARANARAQAA